jgi:acetyl esterase/lipase
MVFFNKRGTCEDISVFPPDRVHYTHPLWGLVGVAYLKEDGGEGEEFPMKPPEIIALYPHGAPGSEGWTQQEEETHLPDGLKVVRNVVQPTLTVFLPDPALASGESVIVCPGGAWIFLAVEHEGTEVARWLNSKGVAVFMLKYRLLHTDDDFPSSAWAKMQDREKFNELMSPLIPLLLADAQQAVRIVRSRAAEWGLSPQQIGMMGFSAGGMVTANLALQYETDSRPDFAAVIYGAPNVELPAPTSAPPLFLLYAQDDEMANGVSMKLYSAWKAGGHSVEMHVYAKGGHGFGMNKQNLPCDHWIERLYEWLKALDK